MGLGRLLMRTPLYPPLRIVAVRLAQPGTVRRWEQDGRPDPPPHAVKQRALRELSEAYGTRVLVETGTYWGDMVAALEDRFDRIYSIELSDFLYEKARRRFRGRDNIEILHGDSAQRLPEVIARLQQPALFWLDGHNSGAETAKGELDTPVIAELRHVLADDPRHVVVIDDARLFGTDPGYPSLDDVRGVVERLDPGRTITVQLDSIRILPRPEPAGHAT